MCPDLHYHPPPLILMKLVKERDSLALTTKKLRDLAKVILSHVNQPMYLDAGDLEDALENVEQLEDGHQSDDIGEATPVVLVSELAGLPEGVLNVVSGFGPTAGSSLCSHMKPTFMVGSTEISFILELQLGAPCQLTLNSHRSYKLNDLIVPEECTWSHAGKGNGISVTVGDPLSLLLNKRASDLIQGQFDKILGVQSGLVSKHPLHSPEGDRYGSAGYYINSTVFSNVKDDMMIKR
ncbi:hypothetical protein Leryth_011262 [Lithospermum erythrorhizon]|nr:hypothetical protein Leryth_011262 [Lithospermum erythrorhizon]